MLSARVHNCLPGVLYSKSDQRILKLKTVLVRGGERTSDGNHGPTHIWTLFINDTFMLLFYTPCCNTCTSDESTSPGELATL